MAYIWGEKYLKEIIRVMDVSDLKFKYDDGTLVLTSSQSVIDACHDRCIPVAAIEEKGKSDLDCDYIIMDVDQVEDDDFEEIYRRCAGLPLDIGITRRTYLREFSMNDLDDLFALYAMPGMTCYMEPLFQYDKEKEYEHNYIEYIYKLYGFGMWLIYDRSDDRLIGRAGIEVRETCDEDNQAELGFCIASDLWRRGLAFEVCSKIIELAKEKYDRKSLIARCDPNNVSSRGLLEKLGFTMTGFEKDGDCRYYIRL